MVDVADFRNAMRLIVGNVSVITAGIGDDRSCLVVISVVSLSAEPPKVIACVNRSSSTWPLIERHRHFGVNSLGPRTSAWRSGSRVSAASRATTAMRAPNGQR